MITKITDENRQSYDERFDLLNEKLSKAGFSFQIKNIASLFANLSEIANATDPETGAYLIPAEYYAMLPVDEPFFEVNANTRVITVPDSFRKNGLSIQNDHLAEIVYFKIDRYFDRNDLANDTNIYIDWKVGKKEGRSVALWPTTAIDNGYIIFGWGISSDMTAEKGTIQFAVRIESASDNDGISGPDLVFNTLIASVGINAGLNISNDVEQIQVENSIRARFLNSSYTPESFDPLPELQFAQNGNLPEIKYFTLIPNEGEENTLELLVTLTGSTEEGRSYVYSWSEQGGVTTSHSSADVSDRYTVTSSNTDNKSRYYWARIQGRRVINANGGEEFYQTTPFLRSEVCCIPKAVAPTVAIEAIESENIQIEDNYIFVSVDSANGDLSSVSIKATATFTDPILPGKVVFGGVLHDENNSEIISSDNFNGNSIYTDWGDEEEEKVQFEFTKTIDELQDSQAYEVMVENTRNHTKAYSDPSNTLIFKAIPNADVCSLSVSVAEEGVENAEFNSNRYDRSENPAVITAQLNIPAYYRGEKSISYQWQKKIGGTEDWIAINTNSNTITIDGNTNDQIKVTGIFNYYGKSVEIVSDIYTVVAPLGI